MTALYWSITVLCACTGIIAAVIAGAEDAAGRPVDSIVWLSAAVLAVAIAVAVRP